jgi:hypothetical protein
MQYRVIGPFEWKGEMVEPGAVITAESPNDDAAIDLLTKAGKISSVPGEQPPAPSEPPCESSEAPPMSSTDMPSHVGRRVPRTHAEQ